ncbi:MAG TPA: hypothetical protein VF233_05775 [Nitrososphaeraceae archaeon]
MYKISMNENRIVFASVILAAFMPSSMVLQPLEGQGQKEEFKINVGPVANCCYCSCCYYLLHVPYTYAIILFSL